MDSPTKMRSRSCSTASTNIRSKCICISLPEGGNGLSVPVFFVSYKRSTRSYEISQDVTKYLCLAYHACYIIRKGQTGSVDDMDVLFSILLIMYGLLTGSA